MAEEVNTQHYKGDNKLILGIVLGVVTFWLFAQSLLNVVPELQRSFHSNIYYYGMNVVIQVQHLIVIAQITKT